MAINNINDLEGLLNSQKLGIETVLYLELRDCDLSVNTPLYKEKVKALMRKVESHSKIKKDAKYREPYEKMIKESSKEIPNPKDIIDNKRLPDHKKKQIGKIEVIDWELREQACLDFLSSVNITFKKDNVAIL